MAAVDIYGGPLRGVQVFEEDSDASAWSQAACVMALGARLTGLADVADDADEDGLDVPELPALSEPFTRSDAEGMISRFGGSVVPGQGGAMVVAVADAAALRRALWRAVLTASTAE